MTPARTSDNHRALPAPRVGPPEALPEREMDPLLLAALAEDLGGEVDPSRDVTSRVTLAPGAAARGRLVAKSNGVLAGLPMFARVFELLDPDVHSTALAGDGDAIAPGQELLRVEGDARALLVGERTALNVVQRLSGIATQTARYVERVAGRARVLDTRKTTPGRRRFDRYAVRCGGGENHRYGLFDEAMVKNNHLDLSGERLAVLLARLRAELGAQVRITAEARDTAEAEEAVRGGADVVLLDNFAPQRLAEVLVGLRALAAQLGHVVEFEASGGIDFGTLDSFAATGVDRLSIGALTHSAPSLDLSFALERAGVEGR